MNVIFLCAGMGRRMYPITKDTPKCLLKYKNETILERSINIVKKHNCIVSGVLGFQHNSILKNISFDKVFYNPCYKFTNSIFSLWMARELLYDETIIINSDVIFTDEIFEKVMSSQLNNFVLCDSSRQCKDADYRIDAVNRVVVDMGKTIDGYFAEYAGITRLDVDGSHELFCRLDYMVKSGCLDTWYETTLLELVKKGFELKYLDISGMEWHEIDNLKDLKDLQ